MNKKIKQILPILLVEVLILSGILTYYFSTDPGLFPFFLPFDFVLSVMVVMSITLGTSILCFIIDFVLYKTNKKIYTATNILYFVAPLIPYIMYISDRF